MKKYKVSVVGANGYGGGVLLRLLAQHPKVEIQFATSRAEAGHKVASSFPNLSNLLPDLEFSEFDLNSLKQSDLVFFATPHGFAQKYVAELFCAGVKVIDLSADFRIKDIDLWEKWYQEKHQAPELVEKAVYGLVEINREKLKTADLVAVAGCYPTSVQLALAPLLQGKNLASNLIDVKSIIADCKSGVSGAGRSLKQASLFCEIDENFKPYSINGHRHTPEIEQGLTNLAGSEANVLFMPHLVPMKTGIEATIYVDLTKEALDLGLEKIHKIYTETYKNEKFVHILPLGEPVQTLAVKGSNHCNIALALQKNKLIVMSVIDNIVKGAAGQAVQCMNLVLGFEETLGLEQAGNWI